MFLNYYYSSNVLDKRVDQPNEWTTFIQPTTFLFDQLIVNYAKCHKQIIKLKLFQPFKPIKMTQIKYPTRCKTLPNQLHNSSLPTQRHTSLS